MQGVILNIGCRKSDHNRESMIKNDLIEAIRDEIGGLSNRDVWEYVSFILEEISQALEKEEAVKITNFGVFETHRKKERIGRNPRTREEATIAARRVVRFRMSEKLFQLLNPDEPDDGRFAADDDSADKPKK